MVKIDEQALDGLIIVGHFLRKHEDAPRLHAGVDMLDHGQPIVRRNELQGVVHHHHGGVLDGDVAHVRLENPRGHRGVLRAEISWQRSIIAGAMSIARISQSGTLILRCIARVAAPSEQPRS